LTTLGAIGHVGINRINDGGGQGGIDSEGDGAANCVNDGMGKVGKAVSASTTLDVEPRERGGNGCGSGGDGGDRGGGGGGAAQELNVGSGVPKS